VTVQTTTEAKTIKLRISYNGVVRLLEPVAVASATKALLERAIALFGNVERPHVEALFRENNSEVSTTGSVEDAGLTDDELLVLRPRTVQGG
jgi:hypothetical protein